MNAGPNRPTWRMVAQSESKSSNDPWSLASTPFGEHRLHLLKSLASFRVVIRPPFSATARSMSWSKFVVNTGQPSKRALPSIRWMAFGLPPLKTLRTPTVPVVSAITCIKDSNRTFTALLRKVVFCQCLLDIMLISQKASAKEHVISLARGRFAGGSRDAPAPDRKANRAFLRASTKGSRTSAILRWLCKCFYQSFCALVTTTIFKPLQSIFQEKNGGT